MDGDRKTWTRRSNALIVLLILVITSSFPPNIAEAPPDFVIESQPPEPVIAGDVVFVNDTKVFLSAQPHTLNMSGWVEIHLISKLFTGLIDVAFGFNTSSAKPLKAEIWTGTEWIRWVTDFERVDQDFSGMDRWLVLRNKTVTAMTEYAIRIWLELIFDGANSGKYFFGVKPSSLTLEEAISANKLYFVDPWWETDFGYRQRLTFDNSGQSEDLINFPVLVNLTDSNFDFTLTQTNGEDIRFIDADNSTSLDYEIEDWDEPSETAFLWVEVPQIDGGSITDHIWMYYGNATIGDGQDVEGTWNAQYVMVQHMKDDTTSTILDSTVNNNDGAKKGANEPLGITSGRIGFAQTFDGSDDYIDVDETDFISLANGTIAAWVNPALMTAVMPMIEVGDVVDTDDYATFNLRGDLANDPFQWLIKEDPTETVRGNRDSVFTVGTYDWLVMTVNASGNAFYNSGVLAALTYATGDATTPNFYNDLNTPDTFRIGADATLFAQFFNGTMDEVRISNITRSADWIAAQYLSMTDALITYSSRQVGFWATTFAISGLPSTVFKQVLTVNGTDYEVGDLPITFEGEFPAVVTYEYLNPVAASLNQDYIISLISGGDPAQTLRLNTFAPAENRTITAIYSTVGNPTPVIVLIGAILGVFVIILLLAFARGKGKK